MLQHYSPYKVAENFNVLAAIAPGRVDLGVGKAPGGLPLSTRALQYGLNPQEKGSFADQLTQLDRWIRPENQSAEEDVRATPLPPVPARGFLAQKVEVWGVELANGQRVTVASEEQAYAFARQAGSEPVRIARRAQSLLAGTAASVLEQLNALHQQWGIDEFIIDTPVADGATRVQSLRLLAEARLNREVTV